MTPEPKPSNPIWPVVIGGLIALFASSTTTWFQGQIERNRIISSDLRKAYVDWATANQEVIFQLEEQKQIQIFSVAPGIPNDGIEKLGLMSIDNAKQLKQCFSNFSRSLNYLKMLEKRTQQKQVVKDIESYIKSNSSMLVSGADTQNDPMKMQLMRWDNLIKTYKTAQQKIESLLETIEE